MRISIPICLFSIRNSSLDHFLRACIHVSVESKRCNGVLINDMRSHEYAAHSAEEGGGTGREEIVAQVVHRLYLPHIHAGGLRRAVDAPVPANTDWPFR